MDKETIQNSALSLQGLSSGQGWQRYAKWLVLALVVLALLVWFVTRNGEAKTRFVTQEVTRGDLTVTVTATGNLEPRNQVDIGSELSGTIRAVYVDVNDVVKEGQVLAVLDTTRLEAQLLQVESSLASAKARVLQAEASEKEARANLARLMKVRELSNNKLPSQQDLDVAEAAVARAEGELAAARAAVAQAQGNVEQVKTDLSKSKIVSPINGVVLVRSVEPGSTVAASLQAPVLFTLAEDLKKMELHVMVDEADVGAVEVGQRATFTVAAFPNRTFSAHITQVHFASSTTSSGSSGGGAASATSTGVVTYETVLEVDNEELLLRPGMTATAEIVTTHISDAVLIPNAALRFMPPMAGAPMAGAPRGNPLSALMPRPPMRGFQPQGQQRGGARQIGRAWVLEQGEPAMVMFRTGATDGRFTQVLPMEGNGGPRPDAAPQGAGPGPQGVDPEAMRAAFQRKLEPGTAVIVDVETTSK
jgi:HlyD family secretion protein